MHFKCNSLFQNSFLIFDCFCILIPHVEIELTEMIKNKIISNKLVRLLFLGFYLSFLVSAIFHSHNIDYKIFQTISCQTEKSAISDPFLDDQANCKLAQFLTNLYFSSPTQNLNDNLPQFQKYFHTYISTGITSVENTLINLRAPPTFPS